ncbi:hypothetical protein N7527_006129 [Penicillium freii]|uniref:Uncharacterized protein n=1 Tax=Penicillium freii TaxID=48697 RepID=A0A101MC70_PENFR|nr:hypothetical protein N7527_006129 [Penicillium freii]KUM57894.1 hypothetical protein ACN42_g9279 [Penicillium freii]
MAPARPQLSKSDFVNPDVLNAVNPHPFWGYAHGHIPDNNPDWKFKKASKGRVTRGEQARALAIPRNPSCSRSTDDLDSAVNNRGDESGNPARCEQSTQTEPVSDNDTDVNPDFTSRSGSGPDCEVVSKSVPEVDSEPEDQEEWPVDAVTDIFAGLYLPSSKLDAAYGPMLE